MKHLVPGYWECTCCLNAFVALYGSLLQATYVGSWWDTLEAKRSINGFPIFAQSLWNTDGASSHSEESFLRRDSTSACLFSELGRYSAVTPTFFPNSSSQICFERQTIWNFFVLPSSRSNQGHYIVHLNMQWLYFLCFQKGFQG